MSIEQIEGESGLYDIRKVKVMYYLGWGNEIVYMVNLDTNEGRFERRQTMEKELKLENTDGYNYDFEEVGNE